MAPADTVIIEVNENTKIIIYTASKDDLKKLSDYDINQIIKDLNAQIADSTRVLEINQTEQKAYVNGKEVPYGKNENVNIRLKGLDIEIDPDEIDTEEWDDDDWENWEREDWTEKSTYSKRPKRTTNHFNIDLGINNWLEDGQFPDANDAPYTVKGWGSWYVALNAVNKTWIAGPLIADWGIGVSWFNWKLEDRSTVIAKGEQRVEFNPSAVPGRKSKLTASYVNAHFVPMIDFSLGRRRITDFKTKGVKIRKYTKQGFRLGVGGFAGYRLGSHSKFVSTQGEKTHDRTNFFLNNFRYGIRAQIGWKDVELFGTYDLNTVFYDNRQPLGSPGLNAIAFGIIL
jgi:hypothetical protein